MKVKVHLNDFLLPILGNRIVHEAGLPTASWNVVCLNSASLPWNLLPAIWQNSNLKVCADGGANRLFYGLSANQRDDFIPHFIVGDLDSLEDTVADYYRSRGTGIRKEPDQDHNDLDKSLRLLRAQLSLTPELPPPSLTSVLILGAFGGRFDQEMANIHALYAWKDQFHRIVLVDGQGTAELLDSDHHHRILPMRTPSTVEDGVVGGVYEGRYCGLIPVSCAAEAVTSEGLQWDLHGQTLAFGGLVSTSNTIPEPSKEVLVQTSHPLLWTCTFDLL